MKAFFKIVIPTFLVFLNSCINSSEEANKEDLYKNVVFIISDDHTYTALGCYGNDIIRTPNLDRLAKEGVRFTNAYSNSPICSASRQSLITGKYPHATGVNLLFTPFDDANNITIAEHLQERGFSTALFGKAHFNDWIWMPLYEDGRPNYGFEINDQGQTHSEYLKSGKARPVPDNITTYSRQKFGTSPAYRWNAQMHPSPCFDEDCNGTFLARQAVEFIESNKDNRFCLWLAFHEPHSPFNFPIEYIDKYKKSEVPLPEGSSEDDRWIPEVFKDLSEDERRGIIASYYTSVEYMDKNVGIVLNSLDSLGLNDNTIVVYLGDQGYLLNDHKRFEKHTMWAEAVKAPMIIRGKKNAGKVTNALTEFVDVVPTVLDALGVPKLEEAQGKSFFSLIESEDDKHRAMVFSEFLEDNKAMVATKEWKYIFTTGKRDLGLGYKTGYGPSGIYHRLYNLIDDPNETTNLAYKNEYQKLVATFQDSMLNRFNATHPDAENLPQNLTKIGKLVWFCEPRDIGAEYGETPLRIFEAENIR